MINDVKSTQGIVTEILNTVPTARENDDLLYTLVCSRLNPKVCHMSMEDFLINRKQLGVPPFESVRRARQKIQQRHPSLRGSIANQKAKIEEEIAMKEWATQ